MERPQDARNGRETPSAARIRCIAPGGRLFIEGYANRLDGRTVVVTTIHGNLTRFGIVGAEMQHGGVVGDVPHAAHGITTAGMTPVVVGEAGRELAWLPSGTMVTPHPAAETYLRDWQQSSGDALGINVNVTVRARGSGYGRDDWRDIQDFVRKVEQYAGPAIDEMIQRRIMNHAIGGRR